MLRKQRVHWRVIKSALIRFRRKGCNATVVGKEVILLANVGSKITNVTAAVNWDTCKQYVVQIKEDC